MFNENSSVIPLYVGLTTLPSRIRYLRATLDSLRNQSKPPDRVLLCLPKWSFRENCAYELPDWLSEYSPLLDVIDCAEDYGPGTKLLGCLAHLPPESCLIVVDDDMVYKPFFLNGLYLNTINNPRKSFSYYTYPAGPFVVGQGADGFSFLAKNLDGILDFAERAIRDPHLRVQDDLWISAFLMQKNIEICSLKSEIPDNGLVYKIVHDINQLHDIEGGLERENVNSAGVRYLLESGLMGKRRQLVALTKKVILKFGVKKIN